MRERATIKLRNKDQREKALILLEIQAAYGILGPDIVAVESDEMAANFLSAVGDAGRRLMAGDISTDEFHAVTREIQRDVHGTIFGQ